MSHLGALIEKPKNIRFDSQQDGETLYFLLRRHPITNLPWIIFSLLFLFIPVFVIMLIERYVADPFAILPANMQLVFVILWYCLVMFFAFENFIIWYFNAYIITDRRIIDIDFKGLWSKRISEAAITSVEDVTFATHRFWQVLFDYGDILMQTAAERTEFEFLAIPRPEMVHDKLTDIVQEQKNRHGGRTIN
jgi:hypothetical protein